MTILQLTHDQPVPSPLQTIAPPKDEHLEKRQPGMMGILAGAQHLMMNVENISTRQLQEREHQREHQANMESKFDTMKTWLQGYVKAHQKQLNAQIEQSSQQDQIKNKTIEQLSQQLEQLNQQAVQLNQQIGQYSQQLAHANQQNQIKNETIEQFSQQVEQLRQQIEASYQLASMPDIQPQIPRQQHQPSQPFWQCFLNNIIITPICSDKKNKRLPNKHVKIPQSLSTPPIAAKEIKRLSSIADDMRNRTASVQPAPYRQPSSSPEKTPV